MGEANANFYPCAADSNVNSCAAYPHLHADGRAHTLLKLRNDSIPCTNDHCRLASIRG